MSYNDLKSIVPKFKMQSTDMVLTSYTGHSLPIEGVVNYIHFNYGNKKHTAPFYILSKEKKSKALIGLPTITQVGGLV